MFDKNSVSDLNMLLEAERAGVKVLTELIREGADSQLVDILKRFMMDEGMNCQILVSLIKNSGNIPSNLTGDFVQKVQALGMLKEKLELLIRGLEWVVKTIRKSQSTFGGSIFLFLDAIKVQHEENIDALKEFLTKGAVL